MTPDKVEAALGVLRELLSRFDATIPTPMNSRGESTMRIEHFVDLSYEAKQALSVLTEALAERERDAARYRWLRENPEHQSIPCFDDGKWVAPYLVDNAGGLGGGVGQKIYDTLDAAIDAAMKETP